MVVFFLVVDMVREVRSGDGARRERGRGRGVN